MYYDLIQKRREANIPVKFERVMSSTKQDFEVEGRIVEGYASAFGNVDSHQDVVVPGAFKRTVDQRMPQKLIKVFQDHWTPVGMPESMKEDSFGLHTVSQITSLPVGDDLLTLVKEGTYSHMSIGYDVIRQEKIEADEAKHTELKELRLWEYSLVIWPANEEATIMGAKSAADAADLADRVLAALDYYRGKGLPRNQMNLFRQVEDVLADTLKEIRTALEPDAVTRESDPAATTEGVVDEALLREIAVLAEKAKAVNAVFRPVLPVT